MSNTLNKVRVLLIAAWLGAAIFFSAAVAPSAFSVLRTFNVPNATEIAGTIVNRTLSVVNTSGFFISLLSIVIVVVIRRRYGARAFIVQLMLLGLMALATGIGQWVIAAKMRTLRKAMGIPIDQVSPADANRVAFAALHSYSVAALSIAIIAGLIVFFVVSKPVEAGRD
jgi:uncharacterized protein DUF4149